METWIYYLIVYKVLGSTCPFTIRGIGSILGIVSMVASIVFVGLTFFFAPQWWYGLVAGAIYLGVPLLTPRVYADDTNIFFWGYSILGSLTMPILLVLMYIDLFS